MKRKLPQWLLDTTNNNDKSAKTNPNSEFQISNDQNIIQPLQHSNNASNIQSGQIAINGPITIVPIANLLSPSRNVLRLNGTHTFNDRDVDDGLRPPRPDSTETVIKDEQSYSIEPSSTSNGHRTNDGLRPPRPDSTETIVKTENSDPIGTSSTSNAANGQQVVVKQEIKDEPLDTATSNVINPPSSVAPLLPKVEDVKPERRSCEYGIKCFRRNPSHRVELAHPGDVDYRRPNLPTAPIGTPPCPWGAACYRRNPQHFMQLSHPPASIYNPTATPAATVTVTTVPQTNPSQRRNRNSNGNNRLVVGNDDDDDESDANSEDEYDIDDPFIDNGSSDEYVPEGDESDDDDDVEDSEELVQN